MAARGARDAARRGQRGRAAGRAGCGNGRSRQTIPPSPTFDARLDLREKERVRGSDARARAPCRRPTWTPSGRGRRPWRSASAGWENRGASAQRDARCHGGTRRRTDLQSRMHARYTKAKSTGARLRAARRASDPTTEEEREVGGRGGSGGGGSALRPATVAAKKGERIVRQWRQEKEGGRDLPQRTRPTTAAAMKKTQTRRTAAAAREKTQTRRTAAAAREKTQTRRTAGRWSERGASAVRTKWGLA